MDAGGAERLGARLLGEVEECGLSELLISLRALINPEGENQIFNIPELDALLPTPAPVPAPPLQQQNQRPDDDTWNPNPPGAPVQPYTIREAKKGPHVLELISPPHAHQPSLSGKTSLLHLITTHAVLPPSLSTTPISGKNATVILIDPLHHFSVPFLARTMLSQIASSFKAAGKDITAQDVRGEIQQCVKRSLDHVHIFRPASWQSLLATLQDLQTYLFDAARHTSTNRPVHSIILEDMDAFIPALRNDSPSSLSSSSSTSTAQPNPSALLPASTTLSHSLSSLATTLSCTIITTSRAAAPHTPRAPIPLAWPGGMQLTRLAVRRVEVVKFAAGMSVVEAEGERGQRGEVVGRGRFEVRRVGVGMGQGQGQGEGFVFRVGEGGVGVEREGEGDA